MARIKKVVEEKPTQKNELFFKNLSDIPRDGRTYLTYVMGELVAIKWNEENVCFSYINRQSEWKDL